MASKSYEKLIQEIGGMTVLELADFVKALETTFGVSAAAPVAAAPVATASAAAPAAEEKTEYKVTLVSAGEAIKAIKALRAAITTNTPNLGQAKEFVEKAPSDLGTFPKAEAQKIKEALEAAGCKVTLS